MENRLIILLIALILLVGCDSNDNIPEISTYSDNLTESLVESSFYEEIQSNESVHSESSEQSNENSDTESNISIDTESSGESEESEVLLHEPSDTDLVLISDYIPNIKTDIRYATENNFTGQVIYESNEAYLRYGTVKKLIKVQNELKKSGYQLLIWDAYRPTKAQWKLWEVCPDASFVANPNNGYSSHSRGNTIDLTIVHLDGSKVEMPSEFDEFSKLADRDYSDATVPAGKNAKLLEDIMEKHGFSGYQNEWWHYSDTKKYNVIE